MTPLVLAIHKAITTEMPAPWKGKRAPSLAGAPSPNDFSRLGQLVATKRTGAAMLRAEVNDGSGWTLWIGPFPEDEASARIRDMRVKIREMSRPRYPLLSLWPVAAPSGAPAYAWYREKTLPMGADRVPGGWRTKSAPRVPMGWTGNRL